MPQFNHHRASALSLCVLLLSCVSPAHAQRVQQGALTFDGVPAPSPAVTAVLPRYQQTHAARFVDWLADGSMLISTNSGDTDQLYRLRTPLGTPEALTSGDEPVTRAATQSFGNDAVVFLRDLHGDGKTQIWIQPLSGATPKQLSDDLSVNDLPLWAHDGKRIAYASNRRNGVNFDAYVLDTSVPGAVPQLVAGGTDTRWQVLDWSLDDRRLLLKRNVSENEAYLNVVDMLSGEIKPINVAAKGQPIIARVTAARFAPDGHGVLFVSDQGGDFLRLRHADLDSNEVHELSPLMSHDIESFDVSGDGHYLAYVYNDAGISRLSIVDQHRKLELTAVDLAPGVISSLKFDRAGSRLALTSENAQAPRDVFVIAPDSLSTVRWTRSELGALDPTHLVAPEVVHFATWDQYAGRSRALSAFVYRAAGTGPHPVLLLLHGGPQAQYRPVFDPLLQYLVGELGFSVVAPNVRGSSGYGRAFAALDDGALREDALRDIGSLLVWVGLQSTLDRTHVFVMGRGYGGYLALAAIEQYGDRLRGGIDADGISDFVTYLEGSSGYRRESNRVEYGDERDVEARGFLQRISPLNNAAAIERPLLIVHGLSDAVVPSAESDQLMAHLRASRREAWYLGAANEGHDMRHKPDLDAYELTVASFLARYCKS